MNNINSSDLKNIRKVICMQRCSRCGRWFKNIRNLHIHKSKTHKKYKKKH